MQGGSSFLSRLEIFVDVTILQIYINFLKTDKSSFKFCKNER